MNSVWLGVCAKGRTCRRALNSTILLGAERTAEELADNAALGDNSGERLDDCETEDSLGCGRSFRSL